MKTIPADIKAKAKELTGAGEGAIAHALLEQRWIALREIGMMVAEWHEGGTEAEQEVLDSVFQWIMYVEKKLGV